MKGYSLYCFVIGFLASVGFASEAALCFDGQCSPDVPPKVFLIGELHPDPDCTEFRQYIASRALEGAVLFGYEYSEEEGVDLFDTNLESLHEERPEFFMEGTALGRQAMEVPLLVILGHAHVPGVHQKLTALGVAHEVGMKESPFFMLPKYQSHAHDFDLQKTQDTLDLLAECVAGDIAACKALGVELD